MEITAKMAEMTGMAGTGTAIKKESQVMQEMSGLDKECGLLSELIDRAEIKLCPVLRASTEATKEVLQRPQRVPLADNIAGMSDRIAFCRARLADLIDRCEI